MPGYSSGRCDGDHKTGDFRKLSFDFVHSELANILLPN
jgi:hypothetical protein